MKLGDVLALDLGPDSDYLAVFIPGGHGAEVGILSSTDVEVVPVFVEFEVAVPHLRPA